MQPPIHDDGQWVIAFLVWVFGLLCLVGAVARQALKFSRQQRADRSTGNVVPFRQE